MRTFAIMGAAALLASACAHQPAVQVTARPDIVGVWQLNRAASDTPSTRRMRGPGRIMGGGMPGRIGMGGPGNDVDEYRTMRRLLDDYMRTSELLTIREVNNSIVFVLGDSTRYDLPTNGKDVKHVIKDLGDTKSKASWKADGLVVDHEIGKIRMRETFSRAPDSPRLIVETRILSSNRPMQFRRVYEKLRE